jgi:hypothetical protein
MVNLIEGGFMKHSRDSKKLLDFLEKYPNVYHSISLDSQTLKAFLQLVKLSYDVELNRYKQIKLVR